MKPENLRLRFRHIFILTIVLSFHLNLVKSEEEDNYVDDFDDELYSVIHSVKDGSLWSNTRKIRSIETNKTVGNDSIPTDNSLWNDLWFECKKKASFSCVRTGVFKYLDKNLENSKDLRLTDSLFFRSNKNKYNGFCENSEEEKEKCLRYNAEKLKVTLADTGKDAKVDEKKSGRKEPIDPVNGTRVDVGNSTEKAEESLKVKEDDDEELEKVADGRSVESLSDLSNILYDKGVHFLMTHDMEIQLPELFFGGGSIKIEPKSYIEGSENEEEGALVKIVVKPPVPKNQIVKGRVIHHLKKLFKKKLMHSFMALMLVIKMIKIKIMFLLPMIIGKATAKKLLLKVLLFLIPGLAHLFKLCHYYHTEHAKYHHHHHKVKHHHHHIKVPVPVPVPIHVDHHNHLDGGYYDKPYEPSAGGYDYPPYPPHHSQGPDNDYDLTGPQGSLNNDYGGVSQYHENEAHLSSWGLGSSNIHEAGVLDAKNQPLFYKNHPYGGYNPQDHAGSYSQRYTTKLQLPKPIPDVPGLSGSFDPFYSPILQKIDKIFIQMGFNDEPCRERLVCSMYKTPHRFSPHSNLISHELSRDARELQKPVASNAAVLRFYKYVQAARDGQDKKDCLRLYHLCAVNTE